MGEEGQWGELRSREEEITAAFPIPGVSPAEELTFSWSFMS